MFEAVHRHMRGKVVHSIKRHTQSAGISLRCRNSNEKRTHQPRTGRHCHCVDVSEGHPRTIKCLLHRRTHCLQVSAASDLRHHPTKTRMLLHTARNHIRQKCLPADNADAGFIARGFDA